MPLFAWKSEYSVGMEVLDEHHKKLFSLLNQLYESTMHSKKVDNLPIIINDLREYTEYHFLAEERYMRSNGFPDTDGHISKHRDFKRRIESLDAQCRADDLEVTRELIIVLGSWLLHHVLEEDRRYSTIKKDDDQ